MKFAIIGLGGRGLTYAHFIKYYGSEIVSVCDVDERKKIFANEYGVSDENFFTDENEFFKKKRADALVVSTLDSLHHRQTLKALELGYDILLEKPIAVTFNECEEIAEKAESLKRKVVVCHVLRYSPFYMKVKELLDDGKIGDVVTLFMSEEIGFYHFAHSYVRGKWRNTKIGTPLILAKNCHDIDMICWLLGKNCLSVSSVGGLKYFKPENAPSDAAKLCSECKYRNLCKYSCFYIYNNAQFEKVAGLASHAGLAGGEKEINAALSDKNNPYSRCVFHCDNDICDHQTVNMLFENQITAQFLSVAFTNEITRHLRIYGSEGSLYDENGDIVIEKLNGGKQLVKIEYPKGGYGHHAGGDVLIVKQFIDYVEKGIKSKNITDISASVNGHKIAFLAEESRKNEGKNFLI